MRIITPLTTRSSAENTKQASRQILMVHEIEILDRLEASQVNKFLYQYTSERYPRQSNANMLQLRALHIRPNAQENAQQECNLKVKRVLRGEF